VLLFRLATAAGFDTILAGCSVGEIQGCDPDYYSPGDGNCGQPGVAKLYFQLLVVIMFMIVVNTYVAIILENMDDIMEEAAQPDSIPPDSISDFYATWARFDPKV
jgi:voltage-gated sodium channel type VIII alpha